MTEQETITYALCPHCSKRASQVCHLEPGRSGQPGPWCCGSCGGWYQVTVSADGYSVAKSDRTTDRPALVFLQRGEVLLAVSDVTCEGKLDGKAYFYNNHTCPTNYLGRVVCIVDLKTGDPDPHGIFEFQGAVEVPRMSESDLEDHVESNWEDLLRQAKEQAEVAV